MNVRRVFGGSIKIAPDEPTECPLCGLTPIQALATKQSPAVIVRPGWVRCSCRGEQEFDVQLELEKREGKEDTRGREARECFFEDVHRDHKPGGASTGRSRRARYSADTGRPEQEWQGFAPDETGEVERLEKLVFIVKAKVPKVLKARLRAEAKATPTTESHLLRWMIERHVKALEMAREVEHSPSNQWVEFKMTKQQFQLFDAKAKALGCSRADLLMTMMLKEWT